MHSLRLMLLGNSLIDPSLSSPPGHCSVGPNDPFACHPEEYIVHDILVGGSSGSSVRKPPHVSEASDSRRRPDTDEAPATPQEHNTDKDTTSVGWFSEPRSHTAKGGWQ